MKNHSNVDLNKRAENYNKEKKIQEKYNKQTHLENVVLQKTLIFVLVSV